MKTQKTFIEKSHINGALIKAVVRQIGGWSEFKERAVDVANHGANAGFCGFIYYSETCAFYAKNQKLIIELAGNLAPELGEHLLEMIEKFNCLDSSQDEIGQTVYGTKRQHDTQVANALAWFALEEVCRSFVDLSER